MEENLKEYELVVHEGRRPFLMVIIAAIFFTFAIYRLYELIPFYQNYELNLKTAGLIPIALRSSILLFASGISYSCTKSVLIDTDKDLLISRFCVGPFSKDVKSKVPDLDYVSVFKVDEMEYQVNLWYLQNKHYKMYKLTEEEHALKFGAMVAKKLNIDLLDATERGNNKWVEKETL